MVTLDDEPCLVKDLQLLKRCRRTLCMIQACGWSMLALFYSLVCACMPLAQFFVKIPGLFVAVWRLITASKSSRLYRVCRSADQCQFAGVITHAHERARNMSGLTESI